MTLREGNTAAPRNRRSTAVCELACIPVIFVWTAPSEFMILSVMCKNALDIATFVSTF